ncbi:MAG: hypothetical protein ABJA66_12820 [Actinomycetota bacterium]
MRLDHRHRQHAHHFIERANALPCEVMNPHFFFFRKQIAPLDSPFAFAGQEPVKVDSRFEMNIDQQLGKWQAVAVRVLLDGRIRRSAGRGRSLNSARAERRF